MMSFRSTHIVANEILCKKMFVHSHLFVCYIAFSHWLQTLGGLLHHRVVFILLLWDFPTLFLIRTPLVHTPTTMAFIFSDFSPSFIILCLFGDTDPKKEWDDTLLWVEVCLSLMVSDVELFVSLLLVLPFLG